MGWIATVKQRVPTPIWTVLRHAWRGLRILRHFGFRYVCPVCGARLRRFHPTRVPPQENEKCPLCESMKRHRLAWLFLCDAFGLQRRPPRRLLHIAPEAALAARFRALPGVQYVTADLMASGVTVRADLTALPFAESSFDLILCSHVLEHVPDDRRAMRELRRVLAPGGAAVLLFPYGDVPTEEAPSASPEERTRRFGQADHVRRYGPDVVERLTEAGFSVEALRPGEARTPEEIRRYALPKGEWLFVGRCVRSGE